MQTYLCQLDKYCWWSLIPASLSRIEIAAYLPLLYLIAEIPSINFLIYLLLFFPVDYSVTVNPFSKVTWGVLFHQSQQFLIFMTKSQLSFLWHLILCQAQLKFFLKITVHHHKKYLFQHISQLYILNLQYKIMFADVKRKQAHEQ